MIVFVDIVQILMFYNVISFSHRFPDDSSCEDTLMAGARDELNDSGGGKER
jgi:hypothetical protein